jgi:hypothetical protein
MLETKFHIHIKRGKIIVLYKITVHHSKINVEWFSIITKGKQQKIFSWLLRASLGPFTFHDLWPNSVFHFLAELWAPCEVLLSWIRLHGIE